MKLILPPIDLEYAKRRIIRFIIDKLDESKLNGVVIGLSGGLDSSVAVTLATLALGSDRVHCLILPDRGVTPKEDIDDAIRLAKKLGVTYYIVEINDIFEVFMRKMPFSTDDNVANGNVKARIRMIILYYYANVNKLLVCGTSDKSEILLGYYTKYGDGGSDILPLGDLYKTQVRQLGRYIGLPERIYNKPSSPRLWKGQMAEKELGVKYEVIDTILYLYFDKGKSLDDIVYETDINRETVLEVLRRVYRNEHKRNTPPIPKIYGLSVSTDWKMPWHMEEVL